MPTKTAHPGVHLQQRAKGGMWNIRFFDPRSGERKQVLKGTLTNDHEEATRIALNVHAFIITPDAWESPPDGYHPRAYALLGVLPRDPNNAGVKAASLAQSLRILAAPSRLMGVDASPVLNRAQRTLDDMAGALKRSQEECAGWKQRAIAAEAQLMRVGQKANKARAAIEGVTLKSALETWSTKLVGDDDYLKNQRNDAGMFVKRFGDNTKLTDMAGREGDISDWIRGLKRQGGKRDGEKIGASRQVELRRVVLSLLRESGLDINGAAVKRPGVNQVRNDRGAIRALTEAQAKAVVRNITDPYFADCFRLQVALGLRPDELITLKRADFAESGGTMTLSLSKLEHLTLKQGTRTIIVPKAVHSIIERRLNAGDILFPYKSKRCKEAGIPWKKAKNFDQLYLRALRAAGAAAKVPFALDCRVGRRTCATILLSKGTAPKVVADILGDNLQTVIEHYGASIPGSNDPSAAAIA